MELEKFGIKVSDIMPGFVDTPMTRDAEVKSSLLEKMGAKIMADDVANLVWKAAHKKRKIHYQMGSTKLMALLFHLFPFLKRMVMKAVSAS